MTISRNKFVREELKLRLFQIALERAIENNFSVTGVLRANLIQFINHGVNQMTEPDYMCIKRIEEAERNLITFIDDMIKTARARCVKDCLDYTSFSITKSKFSSLWPYVNY